MSDYARSVWRRKGLVVGGLVLGLLLGLLAFPRVLPSEPRYDARARLDVRSLSVNPGGQGDPSQSAGAPLGAGALAPDTTAAENAINSLGPPARQLRVLKRHSRARWATKLAGAVRSSAIANTTQVQVSLADDDPALAEAALQAYLDAYVTRRNSVYDRQVREILNKLSTDATALRNEVLRWSRQADSERGGSGPSVVTTTRLELAKERYAAKTAQIDAVSEAAALNLTPTRVLDKATAVPSDNAGNAGVSLALGLLLGIMGGVGLAFLSEATWPKIVTPGDAHVATGLSVLASVPRLPRGLKDSRIVVADRPFSLWPPRITGGSATASSARVCSDIQVLAVVSATPATASPCSPPTWPTPWPARGARWCWSPATCGSPRSRSCSASAAPRSGRGPPGRPGLPAIALLSINDHLLASGRPAGQASRGAAGLQAARETIQTLREIGMVILDTPPARNSADAMPCPASPTRPFWSPGRA